MPTWEKIYWLVFLAVGLGTTVWLLSKALCMAKHLDYRHESDHWKREALKFKKRAEWAEMYAGQLEAELRVPRPDRMNSESWRRAMRNDL